VKKLIIALLAVAALSGAVFADTESEAEQVETGKLTEGWYSFGFEFGNSFEHTDEGTFYIGAPGFNLNAYSFRNKKNVGVFFHYSFLFPVVKSDETYDVQFDYIFGPGFRYSLSENLKLKFGAGISWSIISGNYTERSSPKKEQSRVAMNWGVGADAGIKYDITDSFFINAGVALSYMFFNHTSLYETSWSRTSDSEFSRKTTFDDSIKGYGLFSARPYLSVGFNYYGRESVLGKPK
jgi:opacity protein-like surface antigen